MRSIHQNNLVSLIILILFIGINFGVYSQSREVLIKAGLIEKMARYTEWPDGIKNAKEFKIGVYGDSTLFSVLQILCTNSKMIHLPINVMYYESLDTLEHLHIIFFSKNGHDDIIKNIEKVKTQPVLMISDDENFIKYGGHVRFYLTNKQTYHFEINHSELIKSGLNMDVMLLDLAKVIQ